MAQVRRPLAPFGRIADRQTAFILAASIVNATIALLVLRGWGTSSDGVELALRVTARVSCFYFLLAFVAAPLRRLAPGPLTSWLVRYRRAFGVTFGISMSMHVMLISRMFVIYAPEKPPMVTWADFLIGIPGLVLVALMTITSFDRLKRALGPTRWKQLHRAGLFFVWSIFFLCLVDSVSRKETDHPVLAYDAFIAILILAMSLRIGAWRRDVQERARPGRPFAAG